LTPPLDLSRDLDIGSWAGPPVIMIAVKSENIQIYFTLSNFTVRGNVIYFARILPVAGPILRLV